VTVVEIDKLVYKYATDFFGLHTLQLKENATSEGKHGEIFIQDARRWVFNQYSDEAKTRHHSYDYIVHDVFSGGSVAAHLFTDTFWTQLKELLRDDGVLAVVRTSHVKGL
jgi:spermidine synthase